MSVTAKNFYRRPLPETCIDFSSDEGKLLFKESLLEGNANIYFKLSSQFRTQDDPAYCGLSTLVMVLNTLEVDPQQVWKAPWRFYHESMLDCCVPLDTVKKTGVNLNQFHCLATCNRLQSRVQYADNSDTFLDTLRQEIISSVKGESTVIVANYDRSQLNQTGTGHFAPLAAFHWQSDRVLILDVARFKYPPHWVKISDLQKAMCSIDNMTKKSRGYVSLTLRTKSHPLVMFGIKANLSNNESHFAESVNDWKTFLLNDVMPNEKEELQLCGYRFTQCFSQYSLLCPRKYRELDKDISCEFTRCLSKVCETVCSEILNTRIAKAFSDKAASVLMLAWPFEPGFSVRSDRLAKLARDEMEGYSENTKNEIDLLNTQLVTLIACYEHRL